MFCLRGARLPLRAAHLVRHHKTSSAAPPKLHRIHQKTSSAAPPKLHRILEYYDKVREGQVKDAAEAKALFLKTPVDYDTFVKPRWQRRSEKAWDPQPGRIHQLQRHIKTVYKELGASATLDGYGDVRANMTGALDELKKCQNESFFFRLERSIVINAHRFSAAELVIFMDSCLHHRYRPARLLRATLAHLSSYLHEESLTPETAVHLILLIGFSRNAPPEVIRSLEDYLLKHVDELSALAVHIVCFGFSSTNTPLIRLSLLRKMCDKISHYFENWHLLPEESRYDSWQEYSLLGDLLKVRMPELLTVHSS